MQTTLIVVTLLSLALASTMSIVAWRLVSEERRRSDARVEALRAGLDGRAPATPHEMFGGAPAPMTSRGLIMAALAMCVGMTLAVGLLFSGFRGETASANPPLAPGQRDAPIELLSLHHEPDGDALVVRGVIRHANERLEPSNLSAVVLVFDREGQLITTGRGDVDQPGSLGGDRHFIVTVPGGADVGKYRVSFRAEDRVVPHVDRRT